MPSSAVVTPRRHVTSHHSAIRAAVLALTLGLAGLANAADSLTLAPLYKAAGTNSDGSAYTGTVAFKVISETTYSIEWTIGKSVIKGFGMRQGDILSATYTMQGQPGLIIYRVKEGGVFAGTWAIKGLNGTGTEVLTPK